MIWLDNFVEESNRIEGIRGKTIDEFHAHEKFIAKDVIGIDELTELVSVLQPDALFRDRYNIPGVRVGNHIAPPSGTDIRGKLWGILTADETPFETHVAYETLHPFTDGNGRSGRALWLWQMLKLGSVQVHMAKELGFLHSFYYQTLAEGK